jgi:RNA polymerase sigma factor (sigma-70 family)
VPGSAQNLPLAESSDAVLIARIRAGDATAYGTLYERHVAAARGLARQLADGEAAAEDAVQDTFANILDVMQRGGGPRGGFRPYLLTAVRRTIYDRHRHERRLQPTDRIEQYDPGLPFIDPALEGLERSMVVRAFQSLPERWQAVLWHTEIEGAKPADVAPLLGLSANGVAALAYRAREGLRQAYLQMHTTTGQVTVPGPRTAGATGAGAGAGGTGADAADDVGAVPVLDERCKEALDKLGAYVRGGLAKRDSRAVGQHLDRCENCNGIYAELVDINTALRDAIGPFVLGTASTAYLATQGGGLGAGPINRFRRPPERRQPGTGVAVATSVLVAVALAMLLISGDKPFEPVAPRPPASAEPPGGQSPKAPGAHPQPPRSLTAPARNLAPPTPRALPPLPVRTLPPPPAGPTPEIGAPLPGGNGSVAMAVQNTGVPLSQDLLANADLPPGVTYLGGASGRTAAMITPASPPGAGR